MTFAAPFLGGIFAGAGAASLGFKPHGPNLIPNPFEINISNNYEDNFSFKKDEKEHYKKHFIDCKSKKDAYDRAQKHGGGEPPSSPHNDSRGSHFHPMRRRGNHREKIQGIHYMYNAVKPFIYKIQKGDCLSKIGAKFGIPVCLIQKWNEMGNSTLIYAGKTLKLYLKN